MDSANPDEVNSYFKLCKFKLNNTTKLMVANFIENINIAVL